MMTSSSSRIRWAVTCVAAWCCCGAKAGRAETVMDWLYGRQPTYYQGAVAPAYQGAVAPATVAPAVTVGAPSSACCAPQASPARPLFSLFPRRAAAVATTPCCSPQPVNCCPQPVACAPVPQCAPTTLYRTRWSRVPVTYYRQVTSTDPATGCATTCMRPCTTYRWQVRRVPSAGCQCAQPVAANSCNTCSPAGVSGSYAVSSPYSTTGGGCSGCSPTTTTTPTPMTVPGQSVQPSLESSPTPADVRPSLKPADETPTIESPTIESPSASVQGSSVPYSVGGTPPTPDVAAGSNREARGENEPSWIKSFKLQPIPDLEGSPAPAENDRQAPRLINPNDRTAQRDVSPPAVRFTPAIWNKSQGKFRPAAAERPVGNRRFDAATDTLGPTRLPQVESDGWRSVSQ